MTVVKVGILGVILRTDRIKMEKEKIKEVLDWPTPKRATFIIFQSSYICSSPQIISLSSSILSVLFYCRLHCPYYYRYSH